MSESFNIAAKLRTDTGKGASRRLRHAGKVPAIVYGAEKEPTMISLKHDDIFHASQDEAFFSHILTLEFGDVSEKVIIKDMQRHPAKVQITHADFLRISESQSLHVNVPLHFNNEEVAPGVKEGGLISHLMAEVEITCLPKDLPEFLVVDMANLQLGATIHLSDIELPEDVTIVALTHGEEHDQPVASIHIPRGEKLIEEGEGEGEGESEEGEAEAGEAE
jgi:large subunit ribosomal protein L25